MGLVRSVLAEKFKAAAAPVIFLGAVVSVLPRIFKKRGLRKKDLVYYLDLCGTRSLGVVLLISALMGMVLALQGALQLRKVGTDIFVVDLVGFAVLKEFGPLMVAIIATGRAGSAFAAEIGTMKVNEEIYALKTLGVAPESFLVTPKLLAMLIAMPILTVFSDAAGIFGGLAVGVTFMNIPVTAYVERTFNVLDEITFLLGVLKCSVFSVLITLAGCYCGFQAEGDAQGVGRGATKAVVLSIFLVIIADAVLTLLYSFIGY
ncbi:MAG: ABC transporter permease [Lentisphaeria bacterium]|nr:ABC transporter permease [Lentisphaeria bacterium]